MKKKTVEDEELIEYSDILRVLQNETEKIGQVNCLKKLKEGCFKSTWSRSKLSRVLAGEESQSLSLQDFLDLDAVLKTRLINVDSLKKYSAPNEAVLQGEGLMHSKFLKVYPNGEEILENLRYRIKKQLEETEIPKNRTPLRINEIEVRKSPKTYISFNGIFEGTSSSSLHIMNIIQSRKTFYVQLIRSNFSDAEKQELSELEIIDGNRSVTIVEKGKLSTQYGMPRIKLDSFLDFIKSRQDGLKQLLPLQENE